MKIDSERSLLNLEAYVKNAQDGEAVKQSQRQEQERASTTEQVKLSDTARDIQKIREIVDATPEIRADKVGHFKKEIEAGNYSVNGDKVAEKMLRESLIDAFI